MRLIWMVVLSVCLFGGYDGQLLIEKKADQRITVAIQDDTKSSETAHKIYSLFVADLQMSGHFLADDTYRSAPYDSNLIYANLRSKQYIIKYRYRHDVRDSLDVKVLDGGTSKLIMEGSYTIANHNKYPFLVHRAVTQINAKLGLTPIDWINRYVVFARYTGRKQSEIVLADYTFGYTKAIIQGGLNLFPHWGSSDQSILYYTSYIKGIPTLMRLDMHSGELREITSSAGMLSCSDVSSDGHRLLLTMAPDGQSDIYLYDITTSEAHRLTDFRGIDVNGVFADDEQRLIFVSNRLGYPNIFGKNLKTGEVGQVVFHGKNNNSVDSYDDLIVYSARESAERFDLYTIHSDGSGERALTSTGINQFPRFSPDGNTILYIKRGYEGNAVGYINLQTNQSMLFPLGTHKIQSLDW